MKHPSRIEFFESRIAPAAIFTYTDIDGDDVTIKTSGGADADLAAANVLVFSDPDAADPRQLQLIDLTLNPGAFAATGITITAKRSPTNGGDGFVNVGRINATLLDLGAVSIVGDLGQIDAGNSTTLNAPGIKSLTVQSMGEFGTSTQAAGDLKSAITGALGSFTVKGNFREAEISVTAATAASRLAASPFA